MTVATNPKIPEIPEGAARHPVIKNVCAFADGRVMTYDPRIKRPVWYECEGVINRHGRRQSQIARKMRMHYQIVYECFTASVPTYGSKNGSCLTIDHIDGNKDNNAISNLRLVSLRENVRSASCKSGLPYAIRRRDNGTYRVVLRVSGRMTHLGTFQNINAALERRDAFLAGASNGI